MTDILYMVAGVLFAVGAGLAVFRIVRGPTILDRMIASDVLLTTLILVVGAEMTINGHTRTIPVMLVLAATAMFATVAVARYVSKYDKTAPGGTEPAVIEPENPNASIPDAGSDTPDSTKGLTP